MKKTIFLTAAMLIASNFACANTAEMFDAMKSCDTYSDGTYAIREVSAGMCNIYSKTAEATTLCTMPVSMARKLAIFKTSGALNEAQVKDMNDIESKYCKTK